MHFILMGHSVAPIHLIISSILSNSTRVHSRVHSEILDFCMKPVLRGCSKNENTDKNYLKECSNHCIHPVMILYIVHQSFV